MERYLDLKQCVDYQKLKIPANIIKEGGVVIFPTETVYGIGVNGLNENAIKRLYKIKNRPLNKPISLLVSSIEMALNLVRNVTAVEYDLMQEFFPGPLTIVLKKKDIIPNILTANGDTVGIRMPQDEMARKLIEYAGVPIATTSANISGNISSTNIETAMKYFGEKVDYYVDGGECKIGISSTVVKLDNDAPYILRKGTISEEQILRVISRREENE